MGYTVVDSRKERNTMHHEIEFRGLTVEGSADYEAATGPTYACGGTPPSWDVEAHTVHLSDVEEFLSWGILEDFSEAVATMAEACMRHTGQLIPSVEALVWAAWEEEMLSAMCDAEQNYDPYDG